MNKHLIWAITFFLIIFMICGTLIYINYNSWTIKFEMDDNTKEAIESIEFDKIYEDDFNNGCYFDGCNYHCCDEKIGCFSTLNYCSDAKEVIKK